MNKNVPFYDFFYKVISNGIKEEEHSEDTRKVYLINIFTFVAILFLLPLGINALLLSSYFIALALLGITFILLVNFIYLRMSYKKNLAAYVISGLFFLLMTYLIYAGGIDQTGPLWAYPLPIILMFLLGFKKGLFYNILFILVNAFILFLPEISLLSASYSESFKLRIILSLILVIFLASASEYLLERAFNKMKELKKTLEKISRQDPLTGLHNRRVYDEDIYDIHNTDGVILICDIDNFKKINDTYGHTVGDRVLVEVSNYIKRNTRQEDVAIRWGGEEFFIFLTHTTLEDGYRISELLRKCIETLPIKTNNDESINITISIGLSIVNETITLASAITSADNAMYLAKKSGRNRIEIDELTRVRENFNLI